MTHFRLLILSLIFIAQNHLPPHLGTEYTRLCIHAHIPGKRRLLYATTAPLPGKTAMVAVVYSMQ